MDHDITAAVAQHPVTAFVDVFAAADSFMKCYYGDTVDDNLLHCLADFKHAVLQIGWSISVSMHILADHVPDYCARHSRGLRSVSAEAHESLHQEARRFLAQWKVPPAGVPFHAAFLARMVAGMNAAHAFSSLQ